MLNVELLLDAMGGIRQDYITEAAGLLGYGQPRQKKNYKRVWRTALIAAAIAALLGVTAYAAASIHQQRQQELKADLQIQENHVADYVQPEPGQTAAVGEPGITLLSVQPSYDEFVRFYVDVYPVPEDYVRDGVTGGAAVETGEKWDLRSVNYFTTLDGESWREAFIHTRDWDFAEEDKVTVTDENGNSWRQPTAEAIQKKQLEQGYDAETQTLTLECLFNREELSTDAAEARVHIICAEYLANIDAQGIETENDVGPLIDFGTVTVPLAETAVRTVYFTEPREFSVDGQFGPVTGRFVGAELNADGVVWLYEMDTGYSGEDMLELTDSYEADAVLELADGTKKPVGMSVRSETGPVLRNYCGIPGTVDIDAVVAITAGGIRYRLMEG